MTHTAISHREQNQLLAAMPFDDWRYIESHLEWVEMPAHSTLFEAVQTTMRNTLCTLEMLANTYWRDRQSHFLMQSTPELRACQQATEAVMIQLMGPAIGLETALGVALVMRLCSMGADALAFGVGLYFRPRQQAPEDTQP